MRHLIILSVTAVLHCWLFVPAKAQQPLFELLSAKATGIRFSNGISETENLNVLAYEYFYNGGGIAVGDINNDGLDDLFFTANMGSNKLYLNQGNLHFKDITREACKDLEGRTGAWKTGVAMADVNGDGLLDIYVCYSGKTPTEQRRNQLFINQGNLHFKESAKEYGLDDPSYSTNAVFFDYDNDGDLDMFLLNHNVIKIDNLELAKRRAETDSLAGNKLYENNNNHFTDVSQKAGIIQNPLTFGLGVAVADINKDGWPDLYVTNDYNEPDHLYINNHDGTFREGTQQSFRHLSQFSMGVDIADYNNDGLPDVMTLDMMPEDNRRQKLLQLQENYESFALMLSQGLYKQYMRNMLQLNNGDGTFSEIGQLAGISNTDWSWCPLLADLDNDGYKDLFVTNGYLRDYTNKDFLRYWGDYKVKKAVDREPVMLMDLVTAMPSTSLMNYVFRNEHDLTFSNKQKEWGITKAAVSSAAVYADLDNDGDLDLVINNINEPATVYRNRSREQNKGNYLAVKLHAKTPNTAAIGAKVTVYANGGLQYEEVNPGRGYLSSLPASLHFGLGNTTHADSIRIIWPDKTTQLLTNVAANQQLAVDYAGIKAPAAQKDTATQTLFSRAKGIIGYKHEDDQLNDFKRQPLMMFMYSSAGPVLAKGDVNNDGREDVYISSDKNQPGRLFVQQPGGAYTISNESVLDAEDGPVTADALFFDANGDGFNDLYLARGGYALFEPNTPALQDALYLNDGKGKLVLAKDALPDVSANSKSCVRACDFDNDGDMDLFIGGRVIPGKYPVPPASWLLVNDGRGKFTAAAVPFANIGMVTDALWTDVNKDGRKDLLLCGEFMPVTLFLNTPAGFTDKTSDYFEQKPNGCWFSMALADVDGDGEDDIVAGNLGLNTQVHTSAKEPAELYYADFDGNGSVDPFFNAYINGISYPMVSRDELNDQIYPMRRKFSSYKSYADATIKDIFSPDELSKAGKLTLTDCRSQCFLRRNGKFVARPLPLQAQFSMVTKIMASDFNHDGKTDLLLLGNHSDNRLKMGSLDASYGCLLQGDGRGQFKYVQPSVSGLSVSGDVKSAAEVTINTTKYMMIGVNNVGVLLYKEQ
ncbi:MAG TPA: VCBS repeat-containing protein [Chitinophaga sp.]|uniref:VCBS repeat-containing protein n=1 Tax=Chitinophaga sp. TaxID=1869181 RepID=UPI002DB9218D|nr:VCBS repeat-containing protein [Chitinophaga sp.]HEU4551683.1 VCBS repeat-containing protein [Chitinophaga sp.]